MKLHLVSVSLDTSQQKWLAASQKDGINWLNLCDLKGFKTQVIQAYNLSGVPRTFLISPQGKILGTDLSLAESTTHLG
ncbi:thioredoxin family protein [Spirosoma panaciterrae]|uniref:TlpA family protein disulfide reductase n=1 Tax=Spirosoma panaciterrae TaxID=496058 RepID=UPI000A036961